MGLEVVPKHSLLASMHRWLAAMPLLQLQLSYLQVMMNSAASEGAACDAPPL
jgi:hypothetical protein